MEAGTETMIISATCTGWETIGGERDRVAIERSSSIRACHFYSIHRILGQLIGGQALCEESTDALGRAMLTQT